MNKLRAASLFSTLVMVVAMVIIMPAAPVLGASPAHSIVGKQLGAQANASISLIVRYEANNVIDPWKIYDPRAPDYVNDLQELEAGKGYWVKSRTGFGLQLSGWQNPIHFSVGWNLIGWLAVATPTPAPTKTPAPPPPTPTPEPDIADYVFRPSVSLGERDHIQNATQSITSVATDWGLGAGSIRVYAGNPDELAPFFAETFSESLEASREIMARSAGQAGESTVFLNMDFFRIQTAGSETERIYRVYWFVAHEYFHLSREKIGRSSAPVWLTEGAMEYLALRAVDKLGIRSWQDITKERFAAADTVTTPLSSFASYEALDDSTSYAIAFQAVNRLVGDDWTLLPAFWREAIRSPEGAFSKVFGVTIEQFYQNFEAYRSQI